MHPMRPCSLTRDVVPGIPHQRTELTQLQKREAHTSVRCKLDERMPGESIRERVKNQLMVQIAEKCILTASMEHRATQTFE